MAQSSQQIKITHQRQNYVDILYILTSINTKRPPPKIRYHDADVANVVSLKGVTR